MSSLFRTKESDRLDALEAENARLRRAVQELSLLNDLSRDIGAARDSEQVMGRIVKQSVRALNAEQGVIALVEKESETSGHTLVRVDSSSGDHPAFRLNEQLLGWMYVHRAPLVVNDLASDERFTGMATSEDVRSLLCVPLLVRSSLIGVLAVYNNRSGSGFQEEDQRLLGIIAAQSAQIIENARLYEEERALLRVREELRLAERIQAGLMPTSAPDLEGYELDGLSRPAANVGGDYFDYVRAGDGRWAVCIADVAGKGLPAALLMANVQAAIRSRAAVDESPAACLRTVNRLMRQSMHRGSFVTMVYGMLDVAAHRFTYANAGHNRPLLRRPDGSVARLETAGIALGLVPEAEYHAETIDLEPDSTLLLYSDGVTEAMNADGEEWGEACLQELLARGERANLEAILQAVAKHAGDAPQHDDMTMVIVRRR